MHLVNHITKMSKNELNKYIRECENNSQNTVAELGDKRNTFMSTLKNGIAGTAMAHATY